MTECAADPECAEWLTCAKSAPGNASGTVDGSWLDNSCVDAKGPTAASLQNALSSCLTGTTCCESAAPVNGGADGSIAPGAAEDGGMFGGSGGTGGEGPTEYGDSGAQDNGTWTCPTEACGCLDCLYAFKHGELPQNTECTTAIQECASNEACGRFLGGFAECTQTTDASNAAAGDQRRLEACLFVEATGEWALEGGFEQFMRTVYPCATSTCSNYCTVETARHCIQCQEQWCEAEYTAYLSDGNALLGTWCRSYCQTHPDDGECPGKCAPYLQAGIETLQLYGQCVQASCPDDC